MKKTSKLALIIYALLTMLIVTNCFAHDLQSSILSTHNQLRAMHKAPALTWDNSLAAFAKHHASQCHFQHSNSSYGENLAAGYSSPESAVMAWYSEVSDYSYSSPGFSHGTGHFTQMVWKNTSKIGCALVACNGKNGTPGHYLVCEYSPAGNITNKGYFKRNVLPPSS